jgi:hypothetical protein
LFLGRMGTMTLCIAIIIIPHVPQVANVFYFE